MAASPASAPTARRSSTATTPRARNGGPASRRSEGHRATGSGRAHDGVLAALPRHMACATPYATFGTTAAARRIRPTATSSHASGGGKAWIRHGSRIHCRREDRTGSTQQLSSSARAMWSPQSQRYSMKPRRHPLLTMIDATITIHWSNPRSTGLLSHVTKERENWST